MVRRVSDPVVWTNLFFVLPIMVSSSVGYYWLSFTLCMSFVTSVSYHLSRETLYSGLDYVFAFSNVFGCLWIVFSQVLSPSICCGCALALSSLQYFRCERGGRLYDLHHSLWHVQISLAVTFLCM